MKNNYQNTVKKYMQNILKSHNIDLEYIIKMNSINIKDFDVFKNLPLFYKEVFVNFNRCKKIRQLNAMNKSDILEEPIWNNRHFTYMGKPIYFTNWVKSGIRYVKDLFVDNNLKTINDIRDTLCCTANYICEYMIIMSVFKNLTERLRSHANFVNIKNKRTFLFNDNNCHNLKNLKCKIFYEVLLKKEISCPLYQKHFNIKYKINQEEWKLIYNQRVNFALDRNIAEFNYKLLNNTLCCKQMLFKWKKEQNGNCNLCRIPEDIEHLIYRCKNVQKTWQLLSIIMKVTIKWKDILIGFYHENNKKIHLLNNIISFIALKIYKYKMYCRLQNIDEKEYNIQNHIKQKVLFWCKVLKYSKSNLKIDVIEKLGDIL